MSVDIEASKQNAGLGKKLLLKRSYSSSSLGSAGRQSLTEGVMTGVLGNMAFNAIGNLPFLVNIPIHASLGDAWGTSGDDDVTDHKLYGKISGDLKAGFADARRDLNSMNGELKAYVADEIEQHVAKLSDLIAEKTEDALVNLTATAQENRELLTNFGRSVETNHREAMALAAEHMLRTSYGQCLEHSTDVVAKHGLYAVMLGDLLSRRQEALAAFGPGDFGSLHGCGAGWAAIYSEGLCREAAAALGYGFQGAKSYAEDYPGCFVQPSTEHVWFNTHPSPAGTWSPSSAGQLCRHEGRPEPTFEPGRPGALHGCNGSYSSIHGEGLCQEAAASLGYSFQGAKSYAADYPGCFVRPSTKHVWFNTHPSPAGAWSPSSAGQLCKMQEVAFEPGKFGALYGCSTGRSGIYSEALCREAAAALGYGFQGAGSFAAEYPGCFVKPSTKHVWFNTHPSPAGTWSPSAAGQLCQTDGRDGRIAVASLKEADMLHSFFSSPGMGTVADAQRLLSCFLQPQHDARSLLGKYLQTLEHTAGVALDATALLSAQSLLEDLIETSMLAADMQDMQLAVVDHFSMRARLEYAAKVGQQLDEAWAVLRQELHASQSWVKFFSSVPDDLAVVEHGTGIGGEDCLEHLNSSTIRRPWAKDLESPMAWLDRGPGAHSLAAESQAAIEACASMTDCNEVIVWATRHCANYQEWDPDGIDDYYQWKTTFHWSPGSTMSALACSSAHPEAMTFSSDMDRVTLGNCSHEGQPGEGDVVAFAAFYIRRKQSFPSLQ